ncbi:hypothetical protein DFH06DRAFT_1145843 [Mycena polygramma]|nr:hypothetical protein DFH06DRAFT_1145843 [Mycena polygramma]
MAHRCMSHVCSENDSAGAAARRGSTGGTRAARGESDVERRRKAMSVTVTGGYPTTVLDKSVLVLVLVLASSPILMLVLVLTSSPGSEHEGGRTVYAGGTRNPRSHSGLPQGDVYFSLRIYHTRLTPYTLASLIPSFPSSPATRTWPHDRGEDQDVKIEGSPARGSLNGVALSDRSTRYSVLPRCLALSPHTRARADEDFREKDARRKEDEGKEDEDEDSPLSSAQAAPSLAQILSAVFCTCATHLADARSINDAVAEKLGTDACDFALRRPHDARRTVSPVGTGQGGTRTRRHHPARLLESWEVGGRCGCVARVPRLQGARTAWSQRTRWYRIAALVVVPYAPARIGVQGAARTPVTFPQPAESGGGDGSATAHTETRIDMSPRTPVVACPVLIESLTAATPPPAPLHPTASGSSFPIAGPVFSAHSARVRATVGTEEEEENEQGEELACQSLPTSSTGDKRVRWDSTEQPQLQGAFRAAFSIATSPKADAGAVIRTTPHCRWYCCTSTVETRERERKRRSARSTSRVCAESLRVPEDDSGAVHLHTRCGANAELSICAVCGSPGGTRDEGEGERNAVGACAWASPLLPVTVSRVGHTRGRREFQSLCVPSE